MSGDNSTSWYDANKDEIKSMAKNQICRWVYKIKGMSLVMLNDIKPRLIAK